MVVISMANNPGRPTVSRRRVLATMAAGPLALQSKGAIALNLPPEQWDEGALWRELQQSLGDRLRSVRMPDLASDVGQQLLANPIAVGDEPALTQSSGWIDAWQSVASSHVVRARDAEDVSLAVRFAAAQGVPLAIRGGAHSYHGTSCAADSLLIWTRALNAVEVHDAFVPQGGESIAAPAVSLGAGCMWSAAYEAVTYRAGRYVQGGGCTTVGVAGLVQGGGFGNFSKAYGMAASSLIEAEVVTADGRIRTVNAHQDPELFWALKGGGGGTFGVITRVTLRTHDLPETLGAIRFQVQARDDAGFRRLLGQFIAHYQAELFNPHWGEQVILTPSRRLIVEMVFQGMSEAEVREAWATFVSFVDADSQAFEIIDPLEVYSTPARLFWRPESMNRLMPDVMTRDPRPDAPSSAFWWTGDGEQAGRFWHGMESLWLDQSLLSRGRREQLADALFDASRIWPVSLHFNKGLAGGSALAKETASETAINPAAVDAFCLALIASNGTSSYPGVCEGPDYTEARDNAAQVKRAMEPLRNLDPDAGAYLYESDYHQADWARRYWGSNSSRLEGIKRRYDPHGLFRVHHGVDLDDKAPG